MLSGKGVPMKPPSEQAVAENRRAPRVDMLASVTVVLPACEIVGPGQNISAQGLYFTTTAALRVMVRVAGSGQELEGELVRVESMGNGQLGIAVRFLPQGGAAGGDRVV